ncbi:MAG: DNA polymerase I [Acidimicrobiales bacterium]|nr:DNA polymerase I [Acidimicrobiales bacterium]
MATLLLIDGNSLTYRAFFALPADMATASGQVTNAVFGFTSMLINLLRDHRPDQVAVCFDRPEPTFRHEAIEGYKAGRAEAPDILRQQMGLVRQVVEALHLPVLELSGFEADDLIATVATQARDRGDDVIVVTGDRDAYQLVEDPHIKVLYNRRGVSDYAFYDEAGIVERTGVTPALYTQYAALRGDQSDNLPGVPGVGEKTAAKLINAYGGLDGIFANIDKQTPKLRQNLAQYEDQVRRHADIMVLRRDAPVEVDANELHLGPIDWPEVRRLFDFLEFRTLGDRLAEALTVLPDAGDAAGGATPPPPPGPGREVVEAEIVRPDGAAGAAAALRALAAGDGVLAVAAGFDQPNDKGDLLGLALVSDPTVSEVTWIEAPLLDDVAVRAALVELVGPGGRPLAGHGFKPAMRALLSRGIDVATLALDTRIAAYLLDPAEARYLLGELLDRYANVELASGDSAPAAAQGQLDFDASGQDFDPAVAPCRDALGTARLVDPLLAALDAQQLRRLNDDVEVPLVRVLARMEHAGIGVDRAELERLNRELSEEANGLTKAIWEDAGHEFNVNSTLQLRQVLYEELGLAPGKKTKTGFSTDAATLEKLAGQHPIVDHLLRYREVEKLRGTYGEGLLMEVAADGRIHATFNQTVARTGRLSSEEPNLHNIPVRSELGRNFRKAFVADGGDELCVADYNQIELRCIAHLAEDPGLIEAFEARRDIHNTTAARVFGVEPDAVTVEQRSKAKMVSYGLAYGMEAYGLAQRLNIATGEAAEILDAYFVAFPAVKAYMERTVHEARQRGYTETLFGRRRQIPELSSPNFRIRQAGERQAMNAGIQGLAADIFKVALVRLDAALAERGSASRIVLQVHDEVILEVPPAEHDAMAELVPAVMGAAFELAVPLEVNLSFGRTWADAK